MRQCLGQETLLLFSNGFSTALRLAFIFWLPCPAEPVRLQAVFIFASPRTIFSFFRQHFFSADGVPSPPCANTWKSCWLCQKATEQEKRLRARWGPVYCLYANVVQVFRYRMTIWPEMCGNTFICRAHRSNDKNSRANAGWLSCKDRFRNPFDLFL